MEEEEEYTEEESERKEVKKRVGLRWKLRKAMWINCFRETKMRKDTRKEKKSILFSLKKWTHCCFPHCERPLHVFVSHDGGCMGHHYLSTHIFICFRWERERDGTLRLSLEFHRTPNIQLYNNEWVASLLLNYMCGSASSLIWQKWLNLILN